MLCLNVHIAEEGVIKNSFKKEKKKKTEDCTFANITDTDLLAFLWEAQREIIEGQKATTTKQTTFRSAMHFNAREP